MKPIQKLIISKVNELLEKQKLTESIEHRATKGSLREIFLKEFIIDLIPDEYDTTTGFIASSNQDQLSPQIDLIINEKTRTPKFLLSESNSIIPFESVFIIIEVKTRINNSIIDQLRKQLEYINNCGHPKFYRTYLLNDLEKIGIEIGKKFKSTDGIFSKPAPFIVAFYSTLNEKKLRQLFSEIKPLLGIWIVGKYFIYPTRENTIEKAKGDIGTLYAVERLLESITVMNQERNHYLMNWTKYLKE